jgi:hypothetical protein
MKTRFPGFATVRAVCYACGWYRIIGYSGANGVDRAIIRVERDRSPCNVLWAKVVIVPAELDPAELAARYPKYRDLEYEWDYRRPHPVSIEAKRPYRDLVKDQPCPRCKRTRGVYLEVYREVSEGRSWHVPCYVPERP